MRDALRGALVGAVCMLVLFGLVLLSFEQEGEDGLAAAAQRDYPDVIAATAWRFAVTNMIAGLLLGAISGWLGGRLFPGARRSGWRTWFVNLGMFGFGFVYLNLRFLVARPMFFDPLLNAGGGFGRTLQSALTSTFSPAGVDVTFAVLFALLVLRAWRASGRAPMPVAMGLVFLLPASIDLSRESPGTPSPDRPNILVLAADSLRPDHLSCHGYARPTSPNLDRLAERSVCFDDAQVPLARTLPSWVSMLTSTHPHTHGFRHMFPPRERRRIHLPLLPRILADHGYRTALLSDYAGECFDAVDMGFDEQVVPPKTSIPLIIQQVFLQRQPYLMPFLDNPVGHSRWPLLGFLMIHADAGRLGDQVESKLRELQEDRRPFFLTAFFSCTHVPYSVPHPYYERFTDPDYRGAHKYGFGVTDPRDLELINHRPPAEDQQQIRNLYDGAVVAFDDAVGGILAQLEVLGIADNTLIVVTADHGENLYELDHLLEHGERLGRGDAANRIPLVFFDPSAGHSPRHVMQPVSSLDLMPTLLSRLGIEIPETVRGHDLGPVLSGGSPVERPLFAETGYRLAGTPDSLAGSSLEYPSILESFVEDPVDSSLVLAERYERRVVSAKQRQIRTEEYKLVYTPTAGGVEFDLYDLRVDPEEQRDLFEDPDHTAIARDLQRQLFDWMLEEPGSTLDGRLHLIQAYTLFE